MVLREGLKRFTFNPDFSFADASAKQLLCRDRTLVGEEGLEPSR